MKSLMIQPILQVMPVNPQQFPAGTMIQILTFTVFLAAVGMTAFLISLYASERFQGDKKKTALIFIGISFAVSALLLCFFGCAVSAVRGIIFCLILVFSSYSDIKTRKTDDYLHIMIALTAFIGIEISDIPGMILSTVLITLPMILVVIICNGKAIGGADVKLSAACAFLLGITKGFAGLIAGLTMLTPVVD